MLVNFHIRKERAAIKNLPMLRVCVFQLYLLRTGIRYGQPPSLTVSSVTAPFVRPDLTTF